MKVEFQTMAGDRGRKAFAVHLVADKSDPENRPSRPGLVPPARPAPAPPAHPAPALPVPAPAVPLAKTPSVPGEEEVCDVLSPLEFTQELTELLLDTVPELTGQQILQTRQGVLEFAKKHGWIDG
jgi:hypothetical protein